MAPEPTQSEHELAQEPGVESVDGADSTVAPPQGPAHDTDDRAPRDPAADDQAQADQASSPQGDAPADEAGEADPLTAAQRQRDEYLDHLRRERAEFDNFRKRATKERMDALDRGAEQVVSNLLHVLDTFGFALAAAQEHPEDQLAKGIEMVYAEFVDVLRKSGLEEIEGVGSAFDPMHHEAMMQVEAESPVDEPTVVEVLRPGYRFKGRVLRPASVKVAK